MKNKKLLRALILLVAVVFVAGAGLFGEADDFSPVAMTTVDAQSVFDSAAVDGAVLSDAAAPDSANAADADADADADAPLPELDAAGSYDSPEDVALFIHLYGRLPDNYITKEEAQQAGWSGGSVEKYCPGKCIGGGRFGNYEGLLPDAAGRSWTECDVNSLGAASRGAERLVFSNDGLIYYTADHYDSFQLLYGAQ